MRFPNLPFILATQLKIIRVVRCCSSVIAPDFFKGVDCETRDRSCDLWVNSSRSAFPVGAFSIMKPSIFVALRLICRVPGVTDFPEIIFALNRYGLQLLH